MTYLCPRCGYETTIKTNIKNHLNRKKVCKPTLKNISLEDYKKLIFSDNKENLQCKHCKKEFSRVDNRKRHEEFCSEKSDYSEAEEIKRLKEKIKELEKENKTTNITNNITNNIQNIVILPFGETFIRKRLLQSSYQVCNEHTSPN
jgi:hypothetical protein